jgi:hypothetical protein
MNTKKIGTIAAAGLLLLGIGISAAPAMAFGHGGHGHGDNMFLLARAAGITHTQMHQAFSQDANLKTDFANVKSTKEALTNCMVSGQSCSQQIAAYTNAQTALSTERLTVMNGLFQKAPNDAQAQSVLSQLNAMKAQRKALFQSVFKNSGGNNSAPSSDE